MADNQPAATLPVGTRVIIHGITSRPAINLKQAEVLSKLNENGRYTVLVESTKDRLLLKPANLRLSQPAPPEAAPPPSTPKAPKDAGYPTEPLMNAFDPDVQRLLAPPKPRELIKELPSVTRQVFCEIGDRSRSLMLRGASPVTCEADFKRYVNEFTWFLLDGWDPTLWENVILGGGAVLACLLPLPTNYGRYRPLKGDYWEYDLYHGRKRSIPEDEPARTMQQYYRETLWPKSDIDLFVFGLDQTAAQKKLIAILTQLQRTIIRAHGIVEVYFVKTQNTVTVTCAAIGRPIQVILRLYESKEAVLNGFDIDCCCVGYDGTTTLITPRAITAIRWRINTINLNIRGEHLTFKIEKSWYYDGEELNSEGWSKWGRSENLERLLMAERLARLQNGVIYQRRSRRHDCGRERPLQMKIVPYPRGVGAVQDFYGSKDKAGNPIWPATTKLEALKKSEDRFAVTWLEGNMPRKPLTWDEWAAKAYVGFKRGSIYNSEEWKRNREERLAREKETKEAELEAVRKEARALVEAEKDQAIAERDSIRLEAFEKEAELKRAKKDEEAKARQAAAEKRAAEAKLAKAREDKERLERRAKEELTRAEVELIRAKERAEALEEAADEKLCCVCLDEEKSVMFEPCHHVSVCASCAFQVNQCPLCKAVPTRKVPVYL